MTEAERDLLLLLAKSVYTPETSNKHILVAKIEKEGSNQHPKSTQPEIHWELTNVLSKDLGSIAFQVTDIGVFIDGLASTILANFDVTKKMRERDKCI